MIPNLISGTEPDANVLKEFETNIKKGLDALAKLSNFKQFAYGDQFTLADIAAILNLPVVRSVETVFLVKTRYLASLDSMNTAQEWRNESM